MLREAFSLRRNLRSLLHRPDDHVPAVDGLRAFAILVVFVSHVLFVTQFVIPNASEEFGRLPLWAKWPIHGFLGVDMFFVISGFLIGGILFREYKKTERFDLKVFFARRFLRLMPLYWVALGLTALAVAWDGREIVQIVNVPVKQNLHEVWKNFLYINNFFRPEEQFIAMSHGWSLAVEEQFYLVLPLLLLIFLRTGAREHGGKVVTFAILGYLGVRLACRVQALDLFEHECGFSTEALRTVRFDPLSVFVDQGRHCLFNVETDVMFDNLYTKYIPLFFGVMGAYLTVFREEGLREFFEDSDLLLIVSLGLLVFNFVAMFVVPGDGMFMPMYQTFFQQPVFGLAVFNVILSATYGTGRVSSTVKTLLGQRALYVVAQLSYSMYLFNLLVVQVVVRGLLHTNPQLTFRGLVAAGLPLSLALAAVVSVLSYLLVEKPFMNLRQLIRASRAGRAQALVPEVGPSTTS